MQWIYRKIWNRRGKERYIYRTASLRKFWSIKATNRYIWSYRRPPMCVPYALHATRNKVTSQILSCWISWLHQLFAAHYIFKRLNSKIKPGGHAVSAGGACAGGGRGLAHVRDSKRAQGTRCTQFPDFKKLRLISSGTPMRQSWTGYPGVLRHCWYRTLRYGAVQLCSSTASRVQCGTRVQLCKRYSTVSFS
jgi:hypothetical protein